MNSQRSTVKAAHQHSDAQSRQPTSTVKHSRDIPPADTNQAGKLSATRDGDQVADTMKLPQNKLHNNDVTRATAQWQV